MVPSLRSAAWLTPFAAPSRYNTAWSSATPACRLSAAPSFASASIEVSDGDLMGDGVNIAARLEGIAAPGTICLSEQAYWQVKSRLDLAVSDLGSTKLKNIAEPVHVYSLEVGKTALAKATKPAVPKPRSIFVPLAAGVVALIVMAGGTWYFFGANRPVTVTSNTPAMRTDAAHLSIVVLPFTNLSGDPSQDYFTDGITENLTTDLSRIRSSFVIARNTAFTFKGKNIDSREISNDLGVRYVLEGSVQRDQNRVCVNAQLIDGATGAHLWADRFEEDLADVFKLQDQVVARLANTLGYELVKAEADKSTYSGNPDAIDLTMRGWTILNQQQLAVDRDSLAKAIELFERALKLDSKIEELFATAIRIDPTNARAYAERGRLYRVTKRNQQAAEAAKNAIRLNSNYAAAYAQLAWYATAAEYRAQPEKRGVVTSPSDLSSVCCAAGSCRSGAHARYAMWDPAAAKERSASATILVTTALACGRSSIRSAPSPAKTTALSMSPDATAAW